MWQYTSGFTGYHTYVAGVRNVGDNLFASRLRLDAPYGAVKVNDPPTAPPSHSGSGDGGGGDAGTDLGSGGSGDNGSVGGK